MTLDEQLEIAELKNELGEIELQANLIRMNILLVQLRYAALKWAPKL